MRRPRSCGALVLQRVDDDYCVTIRRNPKQCGPYPAVGMLESVYQRGVFIGWLYTSLDGSSWKKPEPSFAQAKARLMRELGSRRRRRAAPVVVPIRPTIPVRFAAHVSRGVRMPA